MKKKPLLKGRVIIHNILKRPVVEFIYRDGAKTCALIASPDQAITTLLVGKEVAFTLDGDIYGPDFHSEIGYALIDPKSFKID
jgi:hypothetical protein